MKSAQRLTVHPWRDPRLILGIMLVLLSTVLGAKLFAAQDDTVAYWSLSSAVSEGEEVDRGDLVSTNARLTGRLGEEYLRVSEALPGGIDDLVWSRDIAAGSLIDSAALVNENEQSDGELPLSVARGSFPRDLHAGDRVDVWVGPGPGEPSEEKSVQVLTSARVLSAGADDDALTGTAATTILVGVSEDELAGTTLSAISAGHVTLVRVS